jgi:hypothetical protein
MKVSKQMISKCHCHRSVPIKIHILFETLKLKLQ